MSDSKPPPESGQLIATGLEVSKQQTVTLTLSLDDLPENASQCSLNGRTFSVSGLMAFTCKNCNTPQADTLPGEISAETKEPTTQPIQSALEDSASHEVVTTINKTKATLNEASDLLLKCTEKLVELQAALNTQSDEKIEIVKQDVKREVKATTGTVIAMLEKLCGDTLSVTTNNDNDDKPPSDNEDDGKSPSDNNKRDGLGKSSDDLERDDAPEEPTNFPDDPSKDDEGSAGERQNLTESAGEQPSDLGSTEPKPVETTSTEIGSTVSSQVLPLSTSSQVEQEDLVEANPQDIAAVGKSETLPSAEDSNLESGEQQSEETKPQLAETTNTDIEHPTDSTQVLPLPASTQDLENQESVETDPKDVTNVDTSVASPVIPDLENKSGDGEERPLASELDKEDIVEDEQQRDESEEQKVEKELAGSSEDIPNARTLPQQGADIPQKHSVLEDKPISETTSLVKDTESGDSESSPPASGVDKKEGDFEETSDAGTGSGSQPTSELPQEHSAPAEPAIEKTADDSKADDGESGVASVPDLVESQLTRKQKKKLRKNLKKEAERIEKEEEQIDVSKTQVLTSASTQSHEKQEEPVGIDPEDITGVETSVALPVVPDLTGTLPQQEADIPQECSALEEAPISETTPLVEDKDQKSGDGELSPPASGVDKKKGDFEEAPDAGSGLSSQPTSDLPQENSAPAESAIADDSGSEMAPVTDPVESQLTRNQKKRLQKQAKKEAERSKKEEEQIDDSQIPTDVMLTFYFVTMCEIRAQKLKPSQIQLPALLQEISLFHRSGDFEKYADINPEDLFGKMLGEGWKERKDIARNICKPLVHFSTQETAKTCAQDMIAYLHYYHCKTTNLAKSRGKVLTVKQLFAKIKEELFAWISSQWSKGLKKYATYRSQTDDKSTSFSWRKKPAKYNGNCRVTKRIVHRKTHMESFEERIVSGCYKYLVFQEHSFKKYQDLLDSDLDFISALPEDSIGTIELLYFSKIFDFDSRLLKSFFDDKTPPADPSEMEDEADPTDMGGSDEDVFYPDSHPGYISETAITIIFSTMRSLYNNSLTLEDVNFPVALIDICMFHQTNEYKNNYKNFHPDTLFAKLFGKEGDWRAINDQARQFCKMVEIRYKSTHFSKFARVLLAFMDHSYDFAPETSEDETMVTKGQFPEKFAVSFDMACQAWICSQFKAHSKNYAQHKADHKESLLKYSEDMKKYSWKPKPTHFMVSEFYKARIEYHHSQCLLDLGNYIILSYYKFVEKSVGLYEAVNDDIDFILTRPEAMMKVTELKFFNCLFKLDEWTPWFSDYFLSLH